MKRSLMLIAAVLAILATGCSVQVQSHDSGVDVDIRPSNIVIQTDAEPQTEPVSVELPAKAESLEIIFSQGAGELRIDGAGSDALSGQVGYWQTRPDIQTQMRGSHYVIEIPGEKHVAAIGGKHLRTDLHLGARVPTRLEVNAGVGDAEIDLTRIPATDLYMKAGVGQVTVIVPENRNVRVELTAGIGANNLRAAGFVKEGSAWLSPDFTASDVLEIRLEAGIGEFRIERR